MTRISLIALTLFSLHTLSAQKTEKIVVKQQSQVYFFRVGDRIDSLIKQDESDLFFINFTPDRKKNTEIKLKNATLYFTNKPFVYKLVYVPGMQYRLIYEDALMDNADSTKVNPKIEVDGTCPAKENITIDICKYPDGKVLLSNTYIYQKKN